MSDLNCELCGHAAAPITYNIPASPMPSTLKLCETCSTDIDTISNHDHWQCLTAAMWSEKAAVQVTAYRLLKRFDAHSWAQEALEILYLDEQTREWAEAGVTATPSEPTCDSNGAVLHNGDTVTLIKDLPVKGAGFTAKRGTSVRGITLTDNPEHVEGRVNGQRIVLVSAFLKKNS